MSATTVAIVPRVVMIVLKKFLTINVMEEVLTALLVVIKKYGSVQGWGFINVHSRLLSLKGGSKIYM